MAQRSPARLLAPLALVGSLIAVIVVLASAGGGSSDGVARTQTQAPVRQRHAGSAKRRREGERNVYRVRPGDVLSSIAERTGVPVERLLELNPDVDPQGLVAGQRIKLRP